MSERTGLSVSQVTDEVLYTGLVEMQDAMGGGGAHWPPPLIHKVVRSIYASSDGANSQTPSVKSPDIVKPND